MFIQVYPQKFIKTEILKSIICLYIVDMEANTEFTAETLIPGGCDHYRVLCVLSIYDEL